MASNAYETIRQATATFSDILKTLSESYTPMLNELRETVTISLKTQSDILQALESFKPELDKILESMDTYKSVNQELSALVNEKIISAIDYSALIKSIQDITIQEAFVSVPELLIPNNFQYEEVSINSSKTIEPSHEIPTRIKRLSFSDALTIIGLMITLLLWLFAPFYNHIVDRAFDKVENVKNTPSITEEQAQQIMEYLSELTTYQQSILNALEASEESAPKHDSNFDDTQPRSATSDSIQVENDKFRSTAFDESGSSE
ncbi:hypothetical protein [[Clostridium] symbiosum]|uniref:hypothetical protein n=1 Tax=Clostridium symbiosum TaxID=1512 RepID=UPI00189B4E4C|nr:hypothetical protein [[Clostridium] symbiosum]